MAVSRHHPVFWRALWILAAIVVVMLVAARIYLGTWLLNYVNNVLQHDVTGYRGSVEDISIHLYRGAYHIHKLVLDKENGRIPTPFISIDDADLSIQWDALFHGRIVSRIILEHPIVNFAVKESESQTGTNVDWTRPIKDLMPIDINLVILRNGRVTYQDFSSTPRVNIYIHHLEGEVRNLRNVENPAEPLPSALKIKGDSIGGGAVRIEGRLNILKDVPDMDLRTQLENVNLPAINNYSEAYGAFDFKNGVLDFYSRLNVKNSQVSGYVKILARDISVDKTATPNPLQVAWSTLVEAVMKVFTNPSKDQFAIRAPLEGSLNNVSSNIWVALGSIARNAFVGALHRGMDENGQGDVMPKEEEQ